MLSIMIRECGRRLTGSVSSPPLPNPTYPERPVMKHWVRWVSDAMGYGWRCKQAVTNQRDIATATVTWRRAQKAADGGSVGQITTTEPDDGVRATVHRRAQLLSQECLSNPSRSWRCEREFQWHKSRYSSRTSPVLQSTAMIGEPTNLLLQRGCNHRPHL